MPSPLPVGPFQMLDLGDGARAPWYMIPFDKEGRCLGPKTRAHLVEAAAQGGFTHVFLFSHGWNNDWPTAIKRYQGFFEVFGRVRREEGLTGDYRPLLVGISWPSTALVLPWEKGPKIAAAPEEAANEAAGEALEEIAEVATLVPPNQRERFYELAAAESWSEAEATELAGILAPVLAQGSDEEGGGVAPSAAALLDAWRALPKGPAPVDDDEEDDFGLVGGGGATPEAAALSLPDPRGAIRAFTVWQMKDRAGRVGAAGVGPLVRDLVAAAPGARFHLVGHSYGAKVVLSALAAQPTLPAGSIESLLLLQPAINGWAFAADVAGEGFPGGYRKVLPIVRQPIFTTFTRHDVPLTRMFHLAVRRTKDLGEVKVAAGAPSRFAALGGFGPQGGTAPEVQEVVMPARGGAYPATPGAKVVALAAHDRIDGHGGVVNEATAWALLNQVRAAGGP
ncbi:MAG TPA: hypothetical protein VF017_03425 [Thermoanaerobaculia bacterium]|nr:hypothetical protein [Thermoanaerobaculia bacterium]